MGVAKEGQKEKVEQQEQIGGTMYIFFFQEENGIRDLTVTGVQTCVFYGNLHYFESFWPKQ